MVTNSAPRMDVVGMRAIARGTKAAETASAVGAHIPEPGNPALYRMALAGDLVFNSAYYSLATTWTRGAALGLLAGVGALVLPKKMGLGDPPKSDLLSNQLMTVAWYTIGGLAAAWTAQCLATRRADEVREFVGGY
jgi:predicted nicotinamide N-methyase